MDKTVICKATNYILAEKRAKELLKSNFPQYYMEKKIDIKSNNYDGISYVLEENRVKVYKNNKYMGWLCLTVIPPQFEYLQPYPDTILTKALLCKFDEKKIWKIGYFHPNTRIRNIEITKLLKETNGKLHEQRALEPNDLVPFTY